MIQLLALLIAFICLVPFLIFIACMGAFPIFGWTVIGVMFLSILPESKL